MGAFCEGLTTTGQDLAESGFDAKAQILPPRPEADQLQGQLIRAAAVEKSAMEVAQHLQRQLALAKKQKEQLEKSLGDAKAGARYNGAGSSEIPQRKSEDL